MKLAIRFLVIAAAILALCLQTSAQNRVSVPVSIQAGNAGVAGDVFTPISKYIAQGNADALSAWFSENMEITVLSKTADASRSQARQILKAFFNSYTPRNFEITHTAGRAGMKYAFGKLYAGGENFNVTIFVSCITGDYLIQQIVINRIR